MPQQPPGGVSMTADCIAAGDRVGGDPTQVGESGCNRRRRASMRDQRGDGRDQPPEGHLIGLSTHVHAGTIRPCASRPFQGLSPATHRGPTFRALEKDAPDLAARIEGKHVRRCWVRPPPPKSRVIDAQGQNECDDPGCFSGRRGHHQTFTAPKPSGCRFCLEKTLGLEGASPRPKAR
jgi:hypothetical protein